MTGRGQAGKGPDEGREERKGAFREGKRGHLGKEGAM